jgi:hypothetical protein
MITGSLEPVSNRATWREQCRVWDRDAGAPMDISEATEIVVQVGEDCRRPILTARLSSNTVILIDDNTAFEFVFTVDQMRILRAGTYEVGITITIDGDTESLMIGTLPVLDGNIR